MFASHNLFKNIMVTLVETSEPSKNQKKTFFRVIFILYYNNKIPCSLIENVEFQKKTYLFKHKRLLEYLTMLCVKHVN